MSTRSVGFVKGGYHQACPRDPWGRDRDYIPAIESNQVIYRRDDDDDGGGGFLSVVGDDSDQIWRLLGFQI